MMDLWDTKYILGMEIRRDRVNKRIWLRQNKYVNFVLQGFLMTDCKPLSVLISVETKLLVEKCPTKLQYIEDMAYVPYASAVGSLMYSMVCNRSDIAQVVGDLSRFMANLGREH
jgi:hypothetical protein